jgi:hypothetical protein
LALAVYDTEGRELGHRFAAAADFPAASFGEITVLFRARASGRIRLGLAYSGSVPIWLDAVEIRPVPTR